MVLGIWCEDVDFPNGATPIVNTNGGSFRASSARCSLVTSSNATFPLMKSTLFRGGAITTGWLSARISIGATSGSQTNSLGFGFGKSGTSSGLFFGWINGSGTVYLNSYNGTTVTTLTSATNITISSIYKVDLQLISYGSSGTLNLYLNGTLTLTYTGNLTISGVSGFDSLFSAISTSSGTITGISEMIAANEPTLGWQVGMNNYLVGNGATQQWSNPAYTNYNPITINDSNATYVNTTAEDQQATLEAQPSGSFQVYCVKAYARAMATSGASTTNIEIGFNNTNTAVVAVASPQAVTSAFTIYEQYFDTDPTSSGGTGPWGASLSGYELDLRSA